MKMKEKDYFDEINTLVKKGLKKEAENKLRMFSKYINSNPSYQGYWWRAKAYDCIDYKKHASKILKDINSASEKKFIKELPQKELPVPALLLKAKTCSNLNRGNIGITTIDEILKRKNVGKAELAEAYWYSAIIKRKINDDMGFWIEDVTKASSLGYKKAQDYLHNMNYKKKR